MNRRNFLKNIMVAGASFAVLPGAGRVWKATRNTGVYHWRIDLEDVGLNPIDCSLTRAIIYEFTIEDLNSMFPREREIHSSINELLHPHP